ncbi:WXG100 family type VII secretion target [Mycolicibacterium flavescens]|uniref:WXG100 family type VII secretion target n=1 Tax=Mycobacterium neumannii TaxID=2048551 RepID=UPI000F6CB988|nr:type VII secretion target [Mycobacterium neumannii]VEG45287.1 WXG100 family type VII secretion target [Mycolicibacterium flavescens]
MSDNLRVDPLEVRMAADHVNAAADSLRSAHGTAHERMGAAAPGWIGSSAPGLSATTTKWEEESAAHYTELLKHAEDLRSAAEKYVRTDDNAATEIDSTGANLGTMGL